MKQVIQSTRTGKLALKDVPEPRVKAGHLLVRTRASLISAGTERLVIDFARKSLAGKAKARPDLVKKVLGKAKRDGIAATIRTVLARLDEPLPLGYSSAGVVEAVGSGLEGAFRVGQRVACAGAGLANHAELNVVPRNLCAPIPDGVADDEACFGTLGSIAMHSVRNLDAKLGETVAVVGSGLLGQIAVQQLSLSGVRVIALDYNPERLELAKKCGAESAVNLGDAGAEDAILGLTQGRGADGVLIAAATDSSEPFQLAGAIARDRARVCMVGMTGTEFPYRDFMQKELNLVVSRSYGPGRYDEDFEGRGTKYPIGWIRWTETDNLGECVRLMDPTLSHRMDMSALITHHFKLEESEAAYTMITGGTEPHMGVVLTYPEGEAKADTPKPTFTPASKESAETVMVGAIGAGNFAKGVLMPEFAKISNVHFHTLATRRGATAEHGATALKFANATADSDDILKNADINAVVITTRHDSHAHLTAAALKAGKNVLVEKPLAMDRAQLQSIVDARNGTDAFFQVGFNRRFAPMTVKIKNHLARFTGPKTVLLRVNAGAVPQESWVNAPDEGGGRIIGEMCHFVDLARFLVGAEIKSVTADAAQTAGGPADDVTATLRFADGSLATIVYTGQGDTAFSKELIEGYAGGTVITMDNYRQLTITENGSTKKESAAQDKGFSVAANVFCAAVKSGGPAPIDEAELVESTVATIAVLESLQSGGRIDL